MVHFQRLYTSDFVTLKKYGKKFKLTYHKLPVRQPGYEINKIRITGINDEKLKCNIIRAKSKIYEYAYCNEFDLFITLTIDPKKYDRSDLKTYYKDFSQFLRNYNRKYNIKIQYLFIPERHKDGKWHMHGFLKGLPYNHLTPNKNGYMDWESYREKFGWVSLDKIRSQEAISKYMTKYINKDLEDSIKDLNAHLYYCSLGLDQAVELKRGTLSVNSIPFDFENDYVKITWTDNKAAALSSII